MSQKTRSQLCRSRPDETAEGSLTARGGRLTSAVRDVYQRFIKLRGCPREIAKGFALGIFVGMSPTMGFQMLISVPLAAMFKWNKLAAAAGVWISNPVTAPLLYGSTYLVGAKLMGLAGHPQVHSAAEGATLLRMIAKAPGVFWAMTIGGVVLGIPLAVAGYYLALSAVNNYRASIQQKIAAGKERLAARRSRRKAKKNRRRRN